MGRYAIYIVLIAHLILSASLSLPALLQIIYMQEHHYTFGTPLTPTMMVALPLVVSFVLFVLTLWFFILKRRGYLVFASIAGIGGYLSYLLFWLPLDEEVTIAKCVFWFIYYGLPMILVFSYDEVRRHIDAKELGRITPVELVRKAKEKPE